MDWDIFLDIHKDMPRQGSGRDKYTQRAFEMIPKIMHPKILDIGCGPGMQTIKLAQLSGGEVIGIDIVPQYLNQLQALIEKEHLQERVTAVNQSMSGMAFPKESFDIIWAEGSIFVIGFERGLSEWKKYIKPDGYLAVHEMAWIQNDPPKEIVEYFKNVYPAITTIGKNIELIKKCNYKLLGYFPLPEDAWWELYYEPLQIRLDDLRIKFKDNPKAIEMINQEQVEINLFRKYNKWYGSVFFVMQKQ